MAKGSGESGFTLIELLTVLSIVSVLSAIALPQYQSYRAQPYDREAQMRLREVAIAEEAYFVDFGIYKSCNQANCATVFSNVKPMPVGLTLQVTGSSTGFSGTASHAKGTGQVFNWSS